MDSNDGRDSLPITKIWLIFTISCSNTVDLKIRRDCRT
jgi:hypothetical protein